MASHYEPGSPRQGLQGCFPLLLLLLVLVAAGVYYFGWRVPGGGTGLNPKAEPRLVVARGDLSAEEQSNIAIYERTSPTLAQVTSLAEQGSFFGLNVQRIPKGVGSGFVWDDEGHIVTNYHVIDGADAARVTLADHKTYLAQQIWADPEQDIAVLWINAPKSALHAVQVGSSHDLKVGQIVFALGDPFGLDQTMTTGIVSALGREVESRNGGLIHGAIQTSAAINPGNSGGPLFDSAGRLIGMNTAILSPSGAFAGIGFAIPVDEINRIVPQLIRHGKVVRPRLGVQVADDEVAEKLGVDKGAMIVNVRPNSPAAKAGMRGARYQGRAIVPGDVIVAIDSKAINNVQDLHAVLEKYQIGDTVTATIIRDGQRQDLKVVLEALGP
jgi:S1-C subfamily serine protease